MNIVDLLIQGSVRHPSFRIMLKTVMFVLLKFQNTEDRLHFYIQTNNITLQEFVYFIITNFTVSQCINYFSEAPLWAERVQS